MQEFIENSDITYFQYAIYANDKQMESVKTEQEAKEVLENLKEKVSEEVNLTIDRVYTKELEAKENIEIASLSDNIAVKVKEYIAEEKKREKATINGVYISVMPVQGRVSSRYGAREDIRDHTHMGLDIAASQGTKIKAASSGTVIFSGTRGGYGNLTIISHGNGITTYYGHCSKLYKEEGDKVEAGDVIGLVGSTGNSTGPHLHFEIRKNGVYVDPAKYLF